MAPIATVDCLLDLLQKLHVAGNGDMKIKCGDVFCMMMKSELTIWAMK